MSSPIPFQHTELLTPPVARAAYSDRTAWLMAEMSRLAYKKFESDAELLNDLARRLAQLGDEEKIKREVAVFFRDSLVKPGAELDALKTFLAIAGFELAASFNNRGTQAFLAKRESDRMAVLSFRGTEKNFQDIKTDLNARFYNRDGIKVHDGFQEAFSTVEPDIMREVSALSDYKLYVTGHSLGGALAVIAARALTGDNVAACYTFGSPRVGNSEFGDAIKAPIYRVVNAADAVPRVPPTWTIDLVIFLGRFIPIPYVRAWLGKFLESFRGYRHHGDMRYLTACREDCRDLRLIANPSLIDRAVWVLQRLAVEWKAGFRDHGIANYCTKLEAYALRRQSEK